MLRPVLMLIIQQNGLKTVLVEVKRISKAEVTVVSSLDVAETFEKNHKDVMESIRNIESTISTAEFFALFYLMRTPPTNRWCSHLWKAHFHIFEEHPYIHQKIQEVDRHN